mgnify:CR=1 FL=1
MAQVCRLVEQEDLGSIQKLILLIFELPKDKYVAFRYICTEIIEDLSYILKDKLSDGTYLVELTQ